MTGGHGKNHTFNEKEIQNKKFATMADFLLFHENINAKQNQNHLKRQAENRIDFRRLDYFVKSEKPFRPAETGFPTNNIK